ALIAAVVRVAVLPVALIGEAWTQPPHTDLELFEVAFPVACAYAVLALALAAVGRRPARMTAFIAADVAFLSVLAYAAGGAEAHIRFAFFIPPIVAAFLGRPRDTAVLAATTVACFAAVVVVA